VNEATHGLGGVLITGGGGQLATDLGAQIPDATILTRADLDVTDHHAVGAAMASLRPNVVFNCAAFHNVDLCETEEHNAFEVNSRAVKRLAERCAESGAKLVHLSTNYVFDGTQSRPYTESDPPSPRSAYAISKLAGEYAALAYAPGALVVRSAGLYGLHGSASKGGNFIVRVLTRAREDGRLRMVADQRLTPTFTADLATALIQGVRAGARGLLHLTNAGECSWYEFTLQVLEHAGVEVPVDAVPTTPTPGVADRPLNGVLESTAAPTVGLRPLRGWEEALADYMERAALRA
jgi:dTDP-4-dehydrorhamnose reductase